MDTTAHEALHDTGSVAKQGGGLGSSLTSVMGTVNPIMGGIGTAIDIGGQIANLAKTSPQGVEKKRATTNQKSMYAEAQNIYNDWHSGSIDADTAIQALKAITGTTAGGGSNGTGNAYWDAGVSDATRGINNMIAQIEGIKNSYVNEDYVAGSGNPLATSQKSIAGGRSGNIQYGANSQRARGASLMRQMLMGTSSGNNFAGDTVAGKLIAPRADVGDTYQTYRSQQSSNNGAALQDLRGLGSRILGTLSSLGGANDEQS